MTWLKRALLVSVGAGVVGTAVADDSKFHPVAWRSKPAYPPVCRPCPPVSVQPRWSPAPPSYHPAPPSTTPKTTPHSPTDPNLPSTDPRQPNPTQPLPPIQAPGAERPTLPGGSDILAEAPARGTGSGGSLLPNVMGDLLGGGGIAGPLPVYVTPQGRFAGIPPVIVLPTGQQIVPAPPSAQPPVDELLRLRSQQQQQNGIVLVSDPIPNPPPNSQVAGLRPPSGTVFDPSLRSRVARIPQYWRGSYKVTENDSPRPTTRAYVGYYFYDNVFKSLGGPNVPRMRLHQEIFGYEQAFLDRRASVGIRMPYNQFTSPGFFNDTGIGDLTLITKVALYDDRATGNLFSTGLLVTVPTGQRPFPSSTTGDKIGGSLLQPFVGYVVRNGPWYAQGFSSLIVPTDNRDVTVFSNDLQVGYQLYRNPTTPVSGVIPTFEVHVNTPLNHRGPRSEPVGFVDQVTMLGGTQILLHERSGIGIGVGAPVTGPRPFSLQTTVQLNLWF